MTRPIDEQINPSPFWFRPHSGFPPSDTVTAGILDTVAADFYNRNYSYRMWVQ